MPDIIHREKAVRVNDQVWGNSGDYVIVDIDRLSNHDKWFVLLKEIDRDDLDPVWFPVSMLIPWDEDGFPWACGPV